MPEVFALSDFIERIVDEGIAAATEDYGQGIKLDGSIAGFEACRGREPAQLSALLSEARAEREQAHRADSEDYWYWRCRELEIEWVANVVSFVLMTLQLPVIVPPTARGMTKAAEVLGQLESA